MAQLVEVRISVATVQQGSVKDVLEGEGDFILKFQLESTCNVHNTWMVCLVLFHEEVV